MLVWVIFFFFLLFATDKASQVCQESLRISCLFFLLQRKEREKGERERRERKEREGRRGKGREGGFAFVGKKSFPRRRPFAAGSAVDVDSLGYFG